MRMPFYIGNVGKARRAGAFSLVELMVATAVLSLLLVVIGSVMNTTSTTIRAASSKIDSFQGARTAFDLMNKRLSEATLNTYWDYDNPSAPTQYVRKSDLQFLITPQSAMGVPNKSGFCVFFQSAEGMSQNYQQAQTQGVLNAWGFYVRYGSDSGDPAHWHRPSHVSSNRYRYRLMQSSQPSENLAIFTTSNSNWINGVMDYAWPIADNIIALIIWPRQSATDVSTISTNYEYDSRTSSSTRRIQYAQLPPMLTVSVIVIDEASALKLQCNETPPAVIENALFGKFNTAALYSQDLQQVKDSLRAANINYQVLTSTVTLRESKWSSTP